MSDLVGFRVGCKNLQSFALTHVRTNAHTHTQFDNKKTRRRGKKGAPIRRVAKKKRVNDALNSDKILDKKEQRIK